MFTRYLFTLALLIASYGVSTERSRANDGLMVPRFEDVTAQSGITSFYKGDWQYMVGGGAAAFDCNGDQFPDLALAGGEGTASLFVNKSKQGGVLQFERATSGIEFNGVTGI